MPEQANKKLTIPKSTTVTPVAAGAPPKTTISGRLVKNIAPPVMQNIPPPRTSLATQLNRDQGKTLKLPPGLEKFNTRSIKSPYFHAIIYGETDARKTSTAALFGSPDDVRIVLTRNKSQAIPLRDNGYEVAHCPDASTMRFALSYPEKVWPEWAERPNRTLILDDISKGKDLLLDENETITNDAGVTKEVRDMRQVHRGAKKDMAEILASILNKPMNFIAIASAQVYENQLTHEENITPELPPAMGRIVLTDFEFIFYINKRTWKFITGEKRDMYQERDDKGRMQTHMRYIFAKNKLPLSMIGKRVLLPEEPMDLRVIWEKVKAGRSTTNAVS